MNIAALSVATLLSCAAFAQNEQDVLRYSYLLGGGTARSNSMAGAIGAVGADLSAAAVNPAGLGLYRTSEFTLSLGLEFNDVDAAHYGSSAANNDTRFFVNDLGLLLSYGEKEGTKWKGSAFGISFDRLNGYHWNTTAVGENVSSTILEQFNQEAQGTSFDNLGTTFPFASHLAYQTFAIDTINSQVTGSQYASAIPFGSPIRQAHDVDERGALNSTSFFFAANHDHKLFIGASLGVVGARYERYTTHREETLDEGLELKDVTYNEELIARGNGVDFKLGILLRPTKSLRLGASVRTPMLMSFSEAYTTDMETNFRDGDNLTYASPEGTFNYRINTPWRATGSFAYIVGKSGLISMDYAFSDMSSGKLRRSNSIDDSYDFALENSNVKSRFTTLHEFRVGTEWRKDNWYFRAGVGLTPDPYVETDPLHGNDQMLYAGGIGYRTSRISIDLGFQYLQNEQMLQQYSPALVEPTVVSRSSVRSLVTFAYRP